jgi:hypothetical protein
MLTRADTAYQLHRSLRRKEMTHNLLLTGARGAVGAALIDELTEFDITCLVHRRPPAAPVASCVRGDVTAPRLGLDRRGFRELAYQLDGIVHCAAAGHLGAGPVDVAGAQHVLEIAELAQVPLYYVSTAFVGRAMTAASKLEAEELVRDSGLPAVLIRPSLVTDELARLNGLLLRGPRDACLDFLPRELVAACIGDIVRAGTGAGEYWLTAGSSALSVQRAIELGRGRAMPRLAEPLHAPSLLYGEEPLPSCLPRLGRSISPLALERAYEATLTGSAEPALAMAA